MEKFPEKITLSQEIHQEFNKNYYSKIDKLNKELDIRGFKVGSIHGYRSQGQRKRVLESFKQNQIQILEPVNYLILGQI